MGVSSAAFLFILLVLGGGMGIPMGVPPGPEDPVMSMVAPDDCVLYASWSGVAKIDPDANPTEKWMGQPMVSKSVAKLRKGYRAMLLDRGQKNDHPVMRQATKIAAELVDIASTEPSALYLSQFQLKNDKLSTKGAVVISLGDQAAEMNTEFQRLLESILPIANNDDVVTAMQVVEIGGQKVIKIEIPVWDFPVFIAIWDDYFVAGLGEGSLPELAVNWKTPQPNWLAQTRDRLKVERVSSIAYLDSSKLTKELFESPGLSNFFAVQPLKELSGEIKSVSWVAGLDADGFLTRTEIQLAEGESSIKSIFGGKPIPKQFVDDVPADPMLGLATRISTKAILEFVKSTAADIGQKQALEDSLQEFQKLTGVKLETELLDAVGDFIYFYYNFDMANLEGGWIASVRIEDEMSFPAIFDELNKGLKRWVDQQPELNFEVKKIGKHEIYSVTHPAQRWNNFAWALVDQQWYFARSPGEIANHVEGQTAENQLTNHATVKDLYEFGNREGFEGPVAIANFNLPRILKLAHPFVMNAIPNPAGENRIFPELDFGWNDIPPLNELINEVQPNFTAVYRTKTGFQMLQRQTYPGASPPVSFFAISAGTLPYAIADLENSRQLLSENRLQRLGLAMHDYHSTLGTFPAAYSADKDGKPLLSWRVHLLPYLDQQDLYKQFHLDEPWDSDHNKSLIEKMPNVFRHPSLQLPAGKTAFLVPVGDQAAFGPPSNPGKQTPQGKKLADMTDGTSLTAMIVEVNKKSAVVWTAPEDIGCDGNEMFRKSAGIRDSERFAIVLCDGSTRSLQRSINPKLLDNILKRNDGNLTALPSRN